MRFPGVSIRPFVSGIRRPATCLHILEGHDRPVASVAVTPNGTHAVSGSGDDTLRVWDLATGACMHAMEGHEVTVVSINVLPDGKRALSGSRDGTLRLWNLETGECLDRLSGHRDDIRCVSVTPDGRRAVVGCADKRVWVWDLDRGELVAALVAHSHFRAMIAGHAGVESVGVTPDGRRAISSGGVDNTVWVWDIDREAVLYELEGHRDYVMRVCVTPDGRRIVSGSADGTLRLWDLENGACLATLDGHRGAVVSLSLTPDATRACRAAPTTPSESGTWPPARASR